MKKNLKILICGFTNSSHILTSILGQKEYVDVYLYTNREKQLREFVNIQKKNKLQGVYADYGNTSLFGKYIKTTADLSELKQVYDVVFIAVPAYAHQSYLKDIKPYLKKGTVLVVQPSAGHGPLLARHMLGSVYDDIVYVGNKTLPWICRVKEFGKACNLLGVADHNEIAVHPKEKSLEITNLLSNLIGLPKKNELAKNNDLYPKFENVDNFIGLTLMNANALFHPCLLYGHFHDWNKWKHYDKPVYAYKDCTDECVKFFHKQDNEVLKVKEAILKQFPQANLDSVYPFKRWVDRTYASFILDTSCLKKSISSNVQLLTIQAPMIKTGNNQLIPDFKDRYFQEDIPTGLLAIKDLAQLSNIKTPFIDSIMKWSQIYTGDKLLEGNKIVEKPSKNCRVASQYGVNSIKDYIKLSL